ncbi:crossover junction endodeoxyribonuclease RuvC [Candidatus Wolfebacteria bacterium RIFCSPLOWO2_01_FULL_38_11]|uniref:Crossover junction endodeoxyribonuclease RuvC n=2 Tax=Candidatus Wolfeibacteriota TaxID=1752735 RepID=A0A0G0GBG1_9BACT|nr:MAG: Crossover junction endodeoxyribonuclease RuvC [Candidatus Wolfebacteria bacterium GW2011_GWC1_37_10]OGM90351.1 MAG: crossover junction endodeoxyribonuclease RuvC [Candidatus Wolfebacteria bacterium RIFCSPLOWO2_01_FULL_38_11]
MLILGIDPGSTRVGYGLIKKEKNNLFFVESGLLEIFSKNKTDRLLEAAKSLSKIIKKHKPNVVAVEKLFFMKNLKTAVEVSETRGVLTLIVGQHKIPLLEFSPSEIKIAVTGYGMADKKAVAKMVENILKIDKIKGPDDISDALAVAITATNFLNNLRQY